MKNITRRKFIGVAAASAGATLLLKSSALAELTPGSELSRLGQLDWTAFSACRNTSFTFSKLGLEPVTLTLASLEDSRSKKRRPTRGECFVLRFSGNPRAKLHQDTYEVNHATLGNFSLFITEGRRAGRSQTFFAVINRVTS